MSTSPLLQPLSLEEMSFMNAWLERYAGDDGISDVSALDGYLTSMLCNPNVILPSKWYPAIWGQQQPVFESRTEAQRFHALLMQLYQYNDQVLLKTPDDFQPSFYYVQDGQQDIAEPYYWCEGFMKGVQIFSWPKLPLALKTQLQKIELFGLPGNQSTLEAKTAKQIQHSVGKIKPAVLALHAYALRT